MVLIRELGPVHFSSSSIQIPSTHHISGFHQGTGINICHRGSIPGASLILSPLASLRVKPNWET
jgi:hypothetical protein